MNGKGDSTRPRTVGYTQWSKNWDRIFKKKKTSVKKFFDTNDGDKKSS